MTANTAQRVAGAVGRESGMLTTRPGVCPAWGGWPRRSDYVTGTRPLAPATARRCHHPPRRRKPGSEPTREVQVSPPLGGRRLPRVCPNPKRPSSLTDRATPPGTLQTPRKHYSRPPRAAGGCPDPAASGGSCAGPCAQRAARPRPHPRPSPGT